MEHRKSKRKWCILSRKWRGILGGLLHSTCLRKIAALFSGVRVNTYNIIVCYSSPLKNKKKTACWPPVKLFRYNEVMLKHKKFETTRERDTELQEVVMSQDLWDVEINSNRFIYYLYCRRRFFKGNPSEMWAPSSCIFDFFAANPSLGKLLQLSLSWLDLGAGDVEKLHLLPGSEIYPLDGGA